MRERERERKGERERENTNSCYHGYLTLKTADRPPVSDEVEAVAWQQHAGSVGVQKDWTVHCTNITQPC